LAVWFSSHAIGQMNRQTVWDRWTHNNTSHPSRGGMKSLLYYKLHATQQTHVKTKYSCCMPIGNRLVEPKQLWNAVSQANPATTLPTWRWRAHTNPKYISSLLQRVSKKRCSHRTVGNPEVIFNSTTAIIVRGFSMWCTPPQCALLEPQYTVMVCKRFGGPQAFSNVSGTFGHYCKGV